MPNLHCVLSRRSPSASPEAERTPSPLKSGPFSPAGPDLPQALLTSWRPVFPPDRALLVLQWLTGWRPIWANGWANERMPTLACPRQRLHADERATTASPSCNNKGRQTGALCCAPCSRRQRRYWLTSLQRDPCFPLRRLDARRRCLCIPARCASVAAFPLR